jgi:hypothetical protein
MYKELETSRFIVGCISDMQNKLYMKILTLLYEPCHFMTILGKDHKILRVLGSEMS